MKPPPPLYSTPNSDCETDKPPTLARVRWSEPGTYIWDMEVGVCIVSVVKLSLASKEHSPCYTANGSLGRMKRSEIINVIDDLWRDTQKAHLVHSILLYSKFPTVAIGACAFLLKFLGFILSIILLHISSQLFQTETTQQLGNSNSTYEHCYEMQYITTQLNII